jgi:hypothetical protein
MGLQRSKMPVTYKKCIGGLCQGDEKSREQRLKEKVLSLTSKQIKRQHYVIKKQEHKN